MSIESNLQSQESANDQEKNTESSIESSPEKLDKPKGEWVQVGIDKSTAQEGNEGSFFANQGVLAYSTEGGTKFIRPNSDENADEIIQSLQNEGYNFNPGLGVPSIDRLSDGSREQQEWQTKFGDK